MAATKCSDKPLWQWPIVAVVAVLAVPVVLVMWAWQAIRDLRWSGPIPDEGEDGMGKTAGLNPRTPVLAGWHAQEWPTE